MYINPLNHHYAMENPASVYDEEAMTALELAGRTTAKVNEVVKSQNQLKEETEAHLAQQDQAITKMNNETMPANVTEEVQRKIDSGEFTEEIDRYAGNLEARVDNLLGRVTEGSTTMDAEVIDMRTGNNNQVYPSAGTAIRGQFKTYAEDYGTIPGLNLVNYGTIYKDKWVPDGGSLSNNTGSKAIECKLRGGAVVSVYQRQIKNFTAGNFGGFAFLNENRDILKSVDVADYWTGLHDGFYITTIPVPEGAVYVRCTLKLGTTWDGTDNLIITHDTIQEAVDSGLTKINGHEIRPNLRDKDILGVCTVSGVNQAKNGFITTGAWIEPNGGIIDHSTSAYITFPVIAGKTLNLNLGVPVDMNSASMGAVLLQGATGNTMYTIKIEDYATGESYKGYPCASIPVPEEVCFASVTVKLSTAWDATNTIIATHDAWSYGGNPIVTKIGGLPIGTSDSTKWSHLKWVCLGDSLTERNHRTTKSYHDYVTEKTGIKVVNMGVSGTGYFYNEVDRDGAFGQRVVSMPADADVITIFGSGNDLGFVSSYLGDPTDTGTNTICGCINTCLDNIYNIKPTIQVGVVAPTPWKNHTPADNGVMVRYCEALEAICKNRGIPYLDLFHGSGLRPNDETFRTVAYSKDDGNGVHPDETGHKMISSHFYAFLEKLIGTY